MKRISRLPFSSIILLSLIPYLLTNADTHTGYTDSDFLTAMGYLGGSAHPPGYGLLTAITYIVTHAPFAFSIYHQASMLSSCIQVINLLLIYQINLIILHFHQSKNSEQKSSETTNKFLALAATLTTAFSTQVWLQASLLEKYNLAALLVLLTLYLHLKPTQNIKTDHSGLPRIRTLLPPFTLGLALSYHELALPLIPLLWLYFQPKITIHKKNITYILCVLCGVSLNILLTYLFNTKELPYSYNFENTLSGLKNHLLRTNYQNFHQNLFQLTNPISGLYHYLLQLSQVYLWIPIGIATFGIISIIQQARLDFKSIKSKNFQNNPTRLLLSYFLLTGPIIATTIGWPNLIPGQEITYLQQLTIIERTQLISFLLISPFIALGINQLQTKLSSRKLIVFIPLSLLIINFTKVNLSQFTLTRSFSQQILNTLPTNSLLIINEDYPTFALLYQHVIHNDRPDVTIIPVNRFIRKHYEDTQNQLKTFNFSSNPERIMDLVGTNITKRPIILFNLPQEYLTHLGIDQQIFSLSSKTLPMFSQEQTSCPPIFINHCKLINAYSHQRNLIQLHSNPNISADTTNNLIQQSKQAYQHNDLPQARYHLLQAWLITQNIHIENQIKTTTSTIHRPYSI